MDTPGQGHDNGRPRNPQGRYVVRAETAERDAKACRLRVQGLSYDQIAQALGFRDRSGARRAVQRALTATVREDAEELVALEAERLDDLTRHLQRVITTRHYQATASGNLARDPDTGDLVSDYGPVIAAARELRQVSESRRRLLGLDAPAKHRLDVIPNDVIQAQIAEYEAQIARYDAEQAREQELAELKAENARLRLVQGEAG
jgi:hypothetical protein